MIHILRAGYPMNPLAQGNFIDRHKTITVLAVSILILASATYLLRDTIEHLLIRYSINHPSPCPASFCQNPFNKALKGGCYCP